MFKFGTIGAYNVAVNNPRCKATQALYDGMVVIPDDASGDAPTPSTSGNAQGDVWVVGNIIDKPEVLDSKTFQVKSGEYVRAFLMSVLEGLTVELDDLVVADAYASLAKNDVLVPAADGSGKWVKADGTTIVASNYKINLVVLEKTLYGDNGLYCKVVAN